MAEICEAANFEERAVRNTSMRLAQSDKNYRHEKQVAEQYAKAYGQFPQDLISATRNLPSGERFLSGAKNDSRRRLFIYIQRT